MSALAWKVTAAGRAALVNAQNTGTLPLRIAHVGVTEQAFTADADGLDLVLPGELKRLTTFAGDAIAADTIHVSITDDSTDSYTLRGFALYFDTGVLFGIYGQAEPILEKSSQAMMLLAFDAIFADIDATSLSFGDTNFALPPATTERTGIVELATVPEAITGTDSTRAITPSTYKAALDDRLGMGAPSGFVKGLLTQATAALFRAALAIKGAALKDEGAGKGLDADLLDGQHGSYYRDYGNLTSVPDTFTPAEHNHDAQEIASGVLGVLRGGTGVATFAAGSYLVGDGTGSIVVKTPSQVLAGIGAAAVAHSHPISEVNALQAALDARPLQASVTSQISTAINGLINGSPGALDTLNELAAAMGDNPNFAATVTNALSTKAGLATANRFTGPNDFYGDVALRVDGSTNSRVTLQINGIRRSLLAVNSGSVGSFVVYASDGGTVMGQLDIGSGGMKYGGGFVLDCKGPEDVFSVLTPGSSPPGSSVQITSPNSVPGIIAQFGMTKRRDIRFDDSGIRLAVSSTTGSATPQFAFSESGSLSVSGGFSCLTFNATSSDIRLKSDVEPFAPRPLHRLLAALPDTHGALTSYIHLADHTYRLGVIAQDAERVEPAYMGVIDISEGQVPGVESGTYKTVDKAGMAYEQAMWSGQEIDRLHAIINALQERLSALEVH